jgi:hypothetical protein
MILQIALLAIVAPTFSHCSIGYGYDHHLATSNTRPWKDHFKSDLRSDQDHLLKKDLRSDHIRSDQDHIFFK